MPIVTTEDGAEIFYKDWGTGQPIVFSHGSPLSADDWDAHSVLRRSGLPRDGILKSYKGFPHGMPTTEADGIDADLLAFIKG